MITLLNFYIAERSAVPLAGLHFYIAERSEVPLAGLNG